MADAINRFRMSLFIFHTSPIIFSVMSGGQNSKKRHFFDVSISSHYSHSNINCLVTVTAIFRLVYFGSFNPVCAQKSEELGGGSLSYKAFWCLQAKTPPEAHFLQVSKQAQLPFWVKFQTNQSGEWSFIANVGTKCVSCVYCL